MDEIKADASLSVVVDPSLVVASSSLRRETPTSPGKIYRFIYDRHLSCHLHIGAAGELGLVLGPPGGQQRDVVHILVEPAGDGSLRAHAGARWSRDFGPPFTDQWGQLGGELRLSTSSWKKGERLDGSFRLSGTVQGRPAGLVGAFHSSDPASGACVAETGGPFREEEVTVPEDPAR